jgi:DNA (cytosine-5)-methyltransferase 1
MTRKPGDTARHPGSFTTLELCAGAGGQSLGLEQAGIAHAGLIEIDKHACAVVDPIFWTEK